MTGRLGTSQWEKLALKARVIPKDLKVTITMDECLDFKDKNESGKDE